MIKNLNGIFDIVEIAGLFFILFGSLYVCIIFKIYRSMQIDEYPVSIQLLDDSNAL